MKLIAEGVETIEQIAYLRKKKCYLIQGYIFSRPVPQAELDEVIKKIEATTIEE